MNLEFVKERDTKNTVRFTERTEEDAKPVVGTLYLSKEKVAELGIDNEVVVTIDKA